MSRLPLPCATLLARMLSVALLLCVQSAEADPAAAFDPGTLRGSAPLNPYVTLWRDETGTATLLQVRAADRAGRFARADSNLSFGFTHDAVWLRFDVLNTAPSAQRWVFEIGYPILDYVTLYAVAADGHVSETRSGDMLPFSRRRVAATTFAFDLYNQPRERTTYYARVQTSGSLKLPLTAYRPERFVHHEVERDVVLWLFYGALMVMALFNLGVFALIRQNEYALYALTLLALGMIQFSLAGHGSEYLFDHSPELANRALPIAIGALLLFIAAFAYSSFQQFPEFARATRVSKLCRGPALALLAVLCVLPAHIGLRVSLLAALGVIVLAPFLLTSLLRHKNEQLRLYLWSWMVLIVTAPLHGLRSANLTPALPLLDWSIQIGIAVHAVITSLALAARLQVAREELGRVNAQLSANVAHLRQALSQAEQATQEAKQATLAKARFVATMSHELRTPLNTIINVPQGLLDDFPELPAAVCTACDARFLLDAQENVHRDLPCGACHSTGTLRAELRTKYVGEPAHTARFLRKIERSGKHLLQMVNSVLDFSKLEAARLELENVDVDVDVLLRETLDEVSELAQNRGVKLELDTSGTPSLLWADPLRLKQVLLNLLSNAIKFSEPEGTVCVHWRCQPDLDVISVRDDGIGIAPEHQERIFESFEQVHTGDTRRYGGTGLGLSISRSLVRMHGGEIWVESAEGHGSTFSFSIPRQALSHEGERALEESVLHKEPDIGSERDVGQ